jgi:uncharacterized protein (TIGR03437 family)
MQENYKSGSISIPDFLSKQSDAPRRQPVPESGIPGNHTGVLLVSIGMIPRGMQGGCVSGSLPARRPIICGCLLLLSLSLARAQQPADRITQAIDNSRRAALPGNVNARTKFAVDQGPVDPSMELPHVSLVLKPSASQQADLDRLVAQQQDPSSPNYHVWLTPDQYADRFGVSQADIDKITAWLGQYGLTVKSVARARNAIAFGGPAGQIESALGVEIHRYQAGGESHFANATDPSIPAALQGLVLAIRGLHDFRLKPRVRRSAQPRYTQDGSHYLGPGDIATIYNINPLYNSGITGTGHKIAVAGQTDIEISDIALFRTFFGLPANSPTVLLVPGSPDPGTSQDDLPEADLDLELAGSVARNATILFVNSSADYGYGGAFESLYYAIDQNLAPVISISYGDCELDIGSAFAEALQGWGTQANAQGQTIFAASGDDGAADCYDIGDGSAIDNALSVDMPGSLPQVTSVGGTELDEGSGSYWNSNNTTNQASALSYIPETSWNDSAIDGTPAASGGGASHFFSKPSWQTGAGVPNDDGRDVPDVSIAASPDHEGYVIYSGGEQQIVGGTSVGGPQFAGIATLLSQYLVANGFESSPNLGNINSTLYPLAPVVGVFHDITTGTNIVNPCEGLRDCTAASIGYEAGPGYDQVTGLGTPNVYNLITAWHGHSVAGQESVTITLAASPASVTFSGTTVLTATVKSSNGGTPTGTVAFSTGNYALGTATLSGSGASAVATLTLNGVQLAVGANTITALYSGDTAYYGATVTATVTVTSPTNGPPSIGGVANGASFTQAFAPGEILSVFGTKLAPATAIAQGLPLPTMLAGTVVTINGIPAPLYYVSATQLNIQIPYEVPANSVATLEVDNNGESVFYIFEVTATAPGIFTFDGGAPVPFTTAASGQVLTLYMTGAGVVSPSVATGAAPAAGTSVADLPAPVGKVTVTVGGVTAALDFVGIPTWSVGVVQINYTVPNVTAGPQPVLVSVGGVRSASTQLTITQ